jgi:prevent-host-death family protein
MSNLNISNLDDFTQRLLPLTVLRRNAGEVLARLSKVGSFIVTKDGRPVAKLSTLEKKTKIESTKERLAKLKPLIGGFRLGIGLTPKQLNKLIDKSYEEMLPR